MPAEPRILSSPATFVLKYVLPIAFATIFGAVTLLLFLDPSGWQPPPDPHDKLESLAATLLSPAFIWMLCGSLKRVRMDDRALYISDYFREVSVPLSEVSEVTESWWGNIKPVTVEFHSPTEFGSSIHFIADLRWATLLGSPPVAQELRDAIARAKQLGLPPN